MAAADETAARVDGAVVTPPALAGLVAPGRCRMNRLPVSPAVLAAVLAVAGCASNPPHTASLADTAAVADGTAHAAPLDATAPPSAASPVPPEDVAVTATSAPPSPAPQSVAGTTDAAPATEIPDTGTADAALPAEDDFAAIYGSTATPAAGQGASGAVLDPWEPMNRRVHAFNNAIDRAVIRPVAHAYATVVPQPVRAGVGNFFDNLGAPLVFTNLLLQGRPSEAVETLGRFLVNTTIGIAGLFDPATKALKMHRHSADFGRTFARWGWQQSRYLELPFLGPHTVRDAFGEIGDISFSPLNYIEEDRTRIPLQALRLTDLRAGLLSVDALRDAAPDEYVLTRDAWLARRRYLLEGDRNHRNEDTETPSSYLMQDPPNPPPATPPTP